MYNTRMAWAFCLLLSLNAFFSNAQSAGNYLYNNSYSHNQERIPIPVNAPQTNNVTLKAEVMMNVKASSYTAIFAITQAGADAYQVDSVMSLRIAFIRNGLAAIGIQGSDIHVDDVSVVPTYDYRIDRKKFTTYSTEVPTGFEMKKNIHVLFKRHELLDRIISAMANADVYDMVKVEYNIEGADVYFEELRKSAMAVLESKKRTYTDFEFSLEMYGISDGFTVVYPMERYKTYTAFNSGTSPHVVSMITTDLNARGYRPQSKSDYDLLNQQYVVETSEKKKTIFYDRVPYNQFDRVINADIAEPCIQITYSMQAAYSLFNPEQTKQRAEAKKNAAQIGLNPELPKKKKRTPKR